MAKTAVSESPPGGFSQGLGFPVSTCPTGATLSMPSVSIGVGFGVFVSEGAFGSISHVSSGVTPNSVDFAGDGIQVQWPTAMSDSAKVVKVEAHRFGSDQCPPRVDVQIGHFVLDRYPGVAVRSQDSCEHPARRCPPHVALFNAGNDVGEQSIIHPLSVGGNCGG